MCPGRAPRLPVNPSLSRESPRDEELVLAAKTSDEDTLGSFSFLFLPQSVLANFKSSCAVISCCAKQDSLLNPSPEQRPLTYMRSRENPLNSAS